MSELKAHNINDLSLHDIANCEFYLKPEADKLIAEMDKEFANLKEDALKTDKAREKWLQLARKQAMELRQQKYKRCLLIISDIKAAMDNAFFVSGEYLDWLTKWHKRWLKIAEQFKEAKCR